MSSVYVHLGSLYSYFELDNSPGSLSAIKQEITKHKSKFVWLEPPENIAEITVVDVLKSESAQQHCDSVKKWATYVYNKWSAHHAAIADILLPMQS
jgi:cystathionine beta-lyase/cystathionine gamma-synthase